jgi:hypothetical protein
MPDDVAVKCPRCSAPVGQWCLTASGEYARKTHAVRLVAVLETPSQELPSRDDGDAQD